MCPEKAGSIEDFEESPVPPRLEFHISEADRQKARRMFEAAGPAVERQNYDYAISMLREAVRLVPDDLRYRQMLRACVRKKFATEGKRPKAGGGLGFQAKLKMAQMRKNWREVMDICEDTLVRNPWHAPAQITLADALFQTGRLDDAIWTLQTMIHEDRDNADGLRQLAHYLELRGDLNDAIQCWQRVLQVQPNDEQAAAKVKNLSVFETIDRGKLEEAESFRDTIRDRREAQLLEEDARAVQSQERIRQRISELEIELDADPTNLNLYFDLADHWLRLNNLDQAEQLLQKAYEVSGQRFEVHMRLADIQIRRMTGALAEALQAQKKDPGNPHLKEQVARLRAQRLQYELEEYGQRVQRYPSELQWRFEYGLRLMQAGRYREAIEQLQRARQDPNRRPKALQYLGRSFFAVGNLDLAVEYLKEALQAVPTGLDDLRLQIHYDLARVAEKKGDLALYREQLNAAAALDYSYRDVAERLERLSKAGQPVVQREVTDEEAL